MITTSQLLGELALVPAQQNTNGSTNAETFRETVTNRIQLADGQTPPRLNPTTNNNTTATTPSSTVNQPGSSFNTPNTSNGVLLMNLNGMGPLDSSPGAPGTRSGVDTVRDIVSSTRPIDVQSQRTRRSSRNLEDASRRRSARNPRQSTSNAQAVNLVRSGAALARPSLDLPPGYGKLFVIH